MKYCCLLWFFLCSKCKFHICYSKAERAIGYRCPTHHDKKWQRRGVDGPAINNTMGIWLQSKKPAFPSYDHPSHCADSNQS